VITGVGFGPEVVQRNLQAEYLERYTLPSMLSQTARELFKWIIACDVSLGDDVLELVSHVAARSGADVTWIVNTEEATWGEILRDRYIWNSPHPSRVVTVGLPAGGAMNRKYLQTIHDHWESKEAGWLSFTGGVLVDLKGRVAYTKRQKNNFGSRKEVARSGLTLAASDPPAEGAAVISEFKQSKTAWLVPSDRDISEPEPIDLLEFGV
tara:strand:- start:14975 stop:15601 length:627 start_codon:yes stop_codon:yes gene_type:complete